MDQPTQFSTQLTLPLGQAPDVGIDARVASPRHARSLGPRGTWWPIERHASKAMRLLPAFDKIATASSRQERTPATRHERLSLLRIELLLCWHG